MLSGAVRRIRSGRDVPERAPCVFLPSGNPDSLLVLRESVSLFADMQPGRSGQSQVLETMKPTLKYADNLRRDRFQKALMHYSKKALATSALAIVLLSPGVQLAAQKVKIDYDKTTDFAKFKTYAWVQGTPVMDPRLDTYIKKSLNDMFQHIGMTEASVSTADIVITYHAAVNTDLSVGTALDPTFAASGGVAIPGQSIWETAGGAAAAHVTKGGLAFEILDRAANRPIWTGTAQRTVSDKPSERWDQVQKALDKLFRTFPPTPQKTTSARQ